MRRILFLCILLASIASCGKIQHEHEVKDVKLMLSIDEAMLRKYFAIKCESLLSVGGYNPTPAEVDYCVDEKIADFIDTIGRL